MFNLFNSQKRPKIDFFVIIMLYIYINISNMNIYIKQMSGELLPIEYDKEWSAERLHDLVYDTLPEDIRPDQKWKIMLFLRGNWVIANNDPLDVEDGEVLDMLIETGNYEVDLPLDDYKGDLWRNTLMVKGSVDIELPFYVNEELGMWYFDEDILEEENLYLVKNRDISPRLDAHEVINRLDLSPCVREFIYSRYFWCYAEILPTNAPRPIRYYCDYKWEETENGNVNIQRPILSEEHPI
jgi:hypothetical protein